ncbi:MAG: sigma-70 family RNA polymerase sigma factor [Akkermansiaceae bacterium]|jgi:RNA polymerase sigma-70 factor (ECF subfamily)|nr:sigma-70 family RNA polymerase sigma factor [Akkermansiaceae bacterium]
MALVISSPIPQIIGRHPIEESVRRTRMIEDTESDSHELAQWQALLEGVRRGDPVAEGKLVENLYPRVAGIIHTLRPRREQMEDLAQEVFLRIFSRMKQFRGGSFPAWVDTITRRVCYDALRKQRVRPEWRFSDLPEDPSEEAFATSVESGRDSAEILERLFARMEPTQVWLIREVELLGRSTDELAREMGWTQLASRLRLMRARRAMAKCYESMKAKGEI